MDFCSLLKIALGWSSWVCVHTYAFANSGKPNHASLPTPLSRSQQIIMQSVHAVQITWHSGSLPVWREINCTSWGWEHLHCIQILCTSNVTICGNMQIFFKSWTNFEHILLFLTALSFQILHLLMPSFHLLDMPLFKQRHLASVISYVSKNNIACKVCITLLHSPPKLLIMDKIP